MQSTGFNFAWLFNFQRTSVALGDSSFILPRPRSSVNTFFEFILNPLALTDAIVGQQLSPSTFIYYTPFFLYCQCLFTISYLFLHPPFVFNVRRTFPAGCLWRPQKKRIQKRMRTVHSILVFLKWVSHYSTCACRCYKIGVTT